MLRCFKPFNVLFSLTLLAGNVSLAQDSLKIRILDKKLKTPIVYAYVEAGHNVRTYSDTLGYCNLGAMDAQDAVSIKCLGYKDCTIPVKEIAKSGIIYLNPKEIALREFVVTPKNNAVIRAPYIRKAHSYAQSARLPYNMEECTFVPLPATGSKKIVGIRIKMEKGRVENPIRLHIYNANEQGLPEQDLLDSNVIIYNKDIYNDEYILSVADRNINLINDKLFIGIEWPGLYQIREEDRYQIGPKVKCAESISENRTFVRTAKYPNWHLRPYSDKRPSNLLVSLDYIVSN